VCDECEGVKARCESWRKEERSDQDDPDVVVVHLGRKDLGDLLWSAAEPVRDMLLLMATRMLLMVGAQASPIGAFDGGGLDDAAAAAPTTNVRPFVANMTDEAGKKYACFRIPALQRVGSALLLFAEGRAGTPGYGFVCRDHGDVRIVLRRSTDEGQSWGPIITAAAEPDHICWNYPGPPLETCSIGQPTPILDESTGDVHLLFSRDNKQVCVTRSADAGLSWQTRANITATTKPNSWPDAWVAPGPQKGVMLPSGRLIAASYYQKNHSWGDDTNPYMFSYSIYSDDHGKTVS
jgi:hypothetical protein